MSAGPRLPIPSGCAYVCIMAQEAVCLCSCGGENHGKGKIEWPGFFCEGCGASFGKNPWSEAAMRLPVPAYGSAGVSEKYRSRFGKMAAAFYCRPCWANSGLDYLDPYTRWIA